MGATTALTWEERVEVIRSYAGTETITAQILDGPDNTGHLWFMIGTLIPVGSRLRVTYSGGFTVAIPADLVRASKFVSAWLAIEELDPAAAAFYRAHNWSGVKPYKKSKQGGFGWRMACVFRGIVAPCH